MSREIDERVVQMKFENGTFERNVQTSIHSLNELKKGLDFKDATKGFAKIDKAANDVKLDALIASVDKLTAKFSFFGEATRRVFQRITDSAINTGTQLVKSLSIDQITPGWDKYGEKTGSVQTIMAATAKQFSNTADQMAMVNGQLEKLNWFTDETSYNFVDMVNNIGKFTSNNIALDESVTAMQGIANWAAISGANANEASRAMYNMSQAMAAGAMKLQDWISIENANMGTAAFKEMAIQSALAAGTLVRSGDKIVTAGKKTEVTVEKFRETLSEGWLRKDVMMDTLDMYGAATNKLNELYESTGQLTSQLVGDIDDYTAGVKSAEDISKDWGMTLEDTQKVLDEFQTETMQFGLKAFKAAQEAKTFEDAINSVKDAVSTGWMKSFEIIFGDYLQAKELWTDLANNLYDIFASGTEARNEMLSLWAEWGGRDYMIDTIWAGLAAILSILNPIKAAWNDVFGELNAFKLSVLTIKIHDFVTSLILSDDAMAKVRRTLHGLFAVIDMFRIVLTGAVSGAIRVFKRVIEELNIDLFDFTGNMADGLVLMRDWLKQGDKVGKVFDKFGDAIIYAIRKIKEFIKWVSELKSVNSVITAFQSIFNENFNGVESILGLAQAAISSFWSFLQGLPRIRSLSDLGNLFSQFKLDVATNMTDVGISFDKFFDIFKKGWEGIKQFVNDFGTKIADMTKTAGTGLAFLNEQMQKIDWAGVALVAMGVMIMGTMWKIADAITTVATAIQKVTGIGASAKGALDSIKKYFDKLTNEREVNSILKLAAAVGILAVSLALIAKLAKEDWPALVGAAGAIAILTGAMAGVMVVFSKVGKANAGKMPFATTMLAFATSIALLAYALNSIKIDDTVNKRIAIVIGAMVSMAALAKFMSSKVGIINAGVMQIIAISLGIKMIVGALNDVSKINPEEAIAALPVVAGIMLVLGAFMRLANEGVIFNKKTEKFKHLTSIGSMVAFVIALYGMMAAIKKIGQMQPDVVAKGLMGLIPVFLMLRMLFKVVNQSMGDVGRFGLMLVSIAAAMNLMIPAIKGMAALKGEEIARAAIPILGISAIFGALIKVTKDNGKYAGKLGLMLLSITGALMALQLVIKTLGRMDFKELAKGTAAVAAIILSFVPLIKGAIGPSDANAVKAITKVIIAISVLLGAVALLAFFDPLHLAAAAGGVSAVFLALGGALKLANKTQAPKLVDLEKLLLVVGQIGLILGVLSMVKNPKTAAIMAAGMSEVLIALGVSAKLMSGIKIPTDKNMKSILEFVGVLGLVMAALGLVSAIAKPAEFLAITTGMSEVMLALAVSGRIMDKAKNPSIYNTRAMAVWVYAVGGVIAALSVLLGFINGAGGSIDGILKLTAGMSEIILALATAARIMGKQGKIELPKATDMAVLGVFVAGLGGMLAYFSGWADPERVLPLATSISAVLLALSIAMRVMAKMTAGLSVDVGSFAIVTAITSVMGIVLAILSQMVNPDTVLPIALGLSAVVLALSAAVKILYSTPPAFMTGAWNALGMMATIVAALGALGIVMGGLYANPSFKQAIDNSGAAMIALGEAIGGFLGGIIGGFFEGALMTVTHTIPAFGTALSEFMTNVTPFIDGLKTIPGGALGLMGQLLGMLLMFTAAEFIAGLGQLPVVGNLLNAIFGKGEDSLKTNFEKFGEALKAFADSVGDVDADKVKTAAKAASMLVDLENSVPREGGALQAFLGSKDLDHFGERMKSFGEALAGFVQTTSGITKKDVEGAANAGQALADLENSLPANNGVLQDWLGSQSLSDFGNRLNDFGYGLYLLKGWLVNFKASDVEAASQAGEMLSTLENSLVRTGGFVTTFLFGEKSLSSFSSRISEFGEGLAAFSAAIDGKLNIAAMVNAITVSTKLSDLEKNLDTTGGAGSIFFGDSSLKNFKTNIEALGEGLWQMSVNVSKVKFDGLESALDYIKRLTTVKGIEEASLVIVSRTKLLMSNVIDVINENKTALDQGGQDIAKWLVEGYKKGVQDRTGIVKSVTIGLANSVITTFEKKMEIASPSAVMEREGVWTVKGLAEGITKEMSAEEAAKKKASNIVSAFEATLNKISSLSQNRSLRFDIWSLTEGKNATESEKSERELALKVEDLKDSAEKANRYRIALDEVAKQVGKDTEEYISAETKLLEAQKSMYELKNEIDELQLSGTQNQKTQKQKAEDYVATIKEYEKAYEFMGKSKEELYQFAREVSGYGMDAKTTAPKYDTDSIIAAAFSDQQVIYAAEAVAQKTRQAVSSGVKKGASQGVEEGTSEGVGEGMVNAAAKIASGDIEGGVSAGADALSGQLSKWVGDETVADVKDTVAKGMEEAGLNGVLGFAKGTASKEGRAEVDKATKGVADTAVGLFAKYLGEHSPSTITAKMGVYFNEGFALGLKDSTAITGVKNATQFIAQTAIDILKGTLQVNSPSKVSYDIGLNFGVGYINGIKAKAAQIQETAKEMAQGASSMLSKVSDSINNILASDGPLSPTITPVLDMETLKRQSGQVSSALSSGSKLKITSASLQAGRIAAGKAEISQNGIPVKESQTNYNFTQNNYSPKALSKIDIYRQTQNQFAQLKGATKK